MSFESRSGGIRRDIELPHTQEWELYHNGFSLCSKKLRVCLAELDFRYVSHPIDLIETGRYENVSRRYLKVNPAGLVPVLVHEGHPIYESHDQIVYAAQHAGALGDVLLPSDPAARAVVEHWVDCASLVGKDPIGGTRERAGHCIPGLTLPLFATMVQAIPYREIARGLLTHPNKKRPLIFATLKRFGIEHLSKLGPGFSLMQRSRRDMGRHLDALNAELEKHGGPWLTGESFTLADVSWIVLLDRLVEADWETHFWGESRRPAVAAYWQRLKGRPSYADAITNMRCDITRRGIEDVRAAKDRDPTLRAAFESD